MGNKVCSLVARIVKKYGIKTDTLIDVGTGAGSFITVVRDSTVAYKNIYGLDIRPRSIEFYRKHSDDSRIKLVKANVAKMPFPDLSVNVITMSNFFYHIGDYAATLAEFYRVLTAGGGLIILDHLVQGKTLANRNFIDLFRCLNDVDLLSIDLEARLKRNRFCIQDMKRVNAAPRIDPQQAIKNLATPSCRSSRSETVARLTASIIKQGIELPPLYLIYAKKC